MKTVLSFLAGLLCMAGAYAQAPTMIAVNELDCDSSFVSYRKLVTEYLVTELAAYDGVRVADPDRVAEAMEALGIKDGTESQPANMDAICKKLGAAFICFGTIDKKGDVFLAKVSLLRPDSSKVGEASFEMKTIEDADDAGLALATQVAKIAKGSGAKKSGN